MGLGGSWSDDVFTVTGLTPGSEFAFTFTMYKASTPAPSIISESGFTRVDGNYDYQSFSQDVYGYVYSYICLATDSTISFTTQNIGSTAKYTCFVYQP